jgi:HEAT repeat protein
VVLFEDPSEDVRWAAVVAAGELRDDETVPALIEAMRDPSPMVANAAERALQRMGKAQRRFGLESET